MSRQLINEEAFEYLRDNYDGNFVSFQDVFYNNLFIELKNKTLIFSERYLQNNYPRIEKELREKFSKKTGGINGTSV